VRKPGHRHNVLQRQRGFVAPAPAWAPPEPAPRPAAGGPEPKVYSGATGAISCALCRKTMNSEQQWQLHAQSKKHLRRLQGEAAAAF